MRRTEAEAVALIRAYDDAAFAVTQAPTSTTALRRLGAAYQALIDAITEDLP